MTHAFSVRSGMYACYTDSERCFYYSEKNKPVQQQPDINHRSDENKSHVSGHARKQPYTSYNLFFLVPFLCWVVIGALMLSQYDKQALFSAVNMRHTPFLDVMMYQISRLGEGAVIAVVLLVLLGIRTLRNKWYVVTALLCNVVPAMLIQLMKRIYQSPRPLQYFNDAAWIHVGADWPRLYHNSFPSGHTAGSFSFLCFLACLLPPRYRIFGVVLFVLALLVGISRIYLAVHFFADIYTGSILGTAVSVMILMIMNYFRPRFFKTNDPLISTNAS